MLRRLVRAELTILLALINVRSYHVRSHFFNLGSIWHQVGVGVSSFYHFKIPASEVVLVTFVKFFKRQFLFVEIFVKRC